jgi:Mg2+ and Co2+ transporter CorA
LPRSNIIIDAQRKDHEGLTPEMHSCVFIMAGVPPTKFFSQQPGRLASVAEKAEAAWVNCIVGDVRAEAEAMASNFGFNFRLVRQVLEGRYSEFVDNETQAAMMLPSVQIRGGHIRIYPVLFLLREGLIVTIQDRHITRFAMFARYAETHLRKIPAGWTRIDKMTSILFRLVDENNERNYNGIKELAGEIDKVSKLLLEHELGFAKLSKAVYDLKHQVTTFQSCLWENYETLRTIQHGDAELISSRPDILDRIDSLIEENSWYIQLGENLTLILGSGAEAMQDYYAIHLLRFNNIISFTSVWLGVLGAMFLVPSTIATAMASAAFSLGPEDVWWYSVFLIITTLASCGLVYVAVTKFWKITMREALFSARIKASIARRTGLNHRSISPISMKPDTGKR